MVIICILYYHSILLNKNAKKNIAPEIKTNIDINSDEFIHNKNVMLKKTRCL